MSGFFFFFFNDTATTEIYTRSIVGSVRCVQETANYPVPTPVIKPEARCTSTLIRRGAFHMAIAFHLSLIHISEPTRPLYISYAVFCLKKKKNLPRYQPQPYQNTQQKSIE
eukprot:TRINITY_DN7771_c0_g1_i2.p1 TRINITY_DN7771_c0_g1~~TRINITY_DN7771_c0_g1_i2.p1  ORF type:complete len:111 (-),score=24.99 TRINITY_DN7771_c0_g1_i2:62-394(-)